MRKFLSWALVLAFFLWAGITLYHQESALPKFSDINWLQVGAIAGLQLVAVTLNGIYFAAVLRRFGKFISVRDSVMLSILTSGANIFLPFMGGAALRSAYLRSRHDFPITSFFGVLAGQYIPNSFFLFVLGTLFFLNLGGLNHPIGMQAFIVFVFGSTVLGYLTFRSPSPFPMKHYLIEKMNLVLLSWQRFSKDRVLVAGLILVAVLNTLISGVSILYAFQVIRFEASLQGSLFLSVFSSIGSMLRLTPGNIGVMEGLMLIGASTIGASQVAIILMSAVVRSAHLAMIVVFFPISYFALFGNLELWKRGKTVGS